MANYIGFSTNGLSKTIAESLRLSYLHQDTTLHDIVYHKLDNISILLEKPTK